MHSHTFRVFISSTFDDLIEERNALQRSVYPKLSALCENHGCRFQAIDLRWGVPQEAGLDQRTADICLQEVRRCRATTPRPNFLILLGSRYGSRTLPREIEASEFQRILLKARDLDLRGRSLLEDWYRLDENRVPAGYYLRSRLEQASVDYKQSDAWLTVEMPLLELLATCAGAIPLPEDDRVKYERSLTEREILTGLLDPLVPDARDHVFAYFREVAAFETLESAQEAEADHLRKFVNFADATQCDLLARQRQQRMKARIEAALEPGHIRKYTASWTGTTVSGDHLPSLCNSVFNDLRTVIEAEVARLTADDPIEAEVAAHRRFAELRGASERFLGRDVLLSRIAEYVSGIEPTRPLVVSGPAGTGKSAILARAAEVARKRFPQAVTVARFIGATPPSVDGRSLLQSLCEELGRKFQIEGPGSLEYRDLVSEFRGRLAWATAERPAIVFIDALDQLSETDNARSLVWLPRQLPQHVRLVVSVLDDSTGAPVGGRSNASRPVDVAAAIRRRSREKDLLPIGDYPKEAADSLLQSWLEAGGRTLKPSQKALVLSAFERCPRPLFLKLAAEEAMRWRSDEQAPRMATADTPDAMLAAIVEQLFDRLSEPSNHGSLLVERSLGYLVAAKNGLTEDEMIGLLSTDREFFDAFIARAKNVGQPLPPGIESLPIAVWVRLYSDLQPYLSSRRADGTTLLAFYHRSLEQAAHKRFLGSPEIAGQRHQHIAKYFTPREPYGFFRLTLEEQRAWAKKLPSEPRPVNIRMVMELPHQLLEVAKLLGKDDAKSFHWDAVAELLLNIHFLEAKAEAPE